MTKLRKVNDNHNRELVMDVTKNSIIAIVILICGCATVPVGITEPGLNIYSAGFYSDGFSDKPCFWTGTDITDLPLPPLVKEFKITGMAIADDGTVFICGQYKDQNLWKACYWKNTERTDLPVPFSYQNSYTSAIVLTTDGSACIAGSYEEDNISRPCYWQGIARRDLNFPSRSVNTYTTAIKITANRTIYTTGYYKGPNGDRPCYWQETARIDLSVPSSSKYGIITSFDVVDNILVYTVGYYDDGFNTMPCYWTGSTRMDLPLPSGNIDFNIGGIAITSKKAVYISGDYGMQIGSDKIRKPCYWQGSTRFDLPDGFMGGYTTNITAVKDGTVFITGFINDGSGRLPCFWHNNTRIDIVSAGYQDYQIMDFFVTADNIVYIAGILPRYNDLNICYWKNREYSNAGYIKGTIIKMLIVKAPT